MQMCSKPVASDPDRVEVCKERLVWKEGGWFVFSQRRHLFWRAQERRRQGLLKILEGETWEEHMTCVLPQIS